MGRPEAALIVGPTGSGKTPLGELLAARSLWGRRCVHFDFGGELRRLAAGESSADLDEAELEAARAALESGALLEDEQFPIAAKVLGSFLAACPRGSAVVVLNGLPRHAGQARAIDSMLDVMAVVSLACPPEVVTERLLTDAGGDRARRSDDDPQAVRARLETFRRRTLPLLEHYRRRGARIETVQVAPTTSAAEVLVELERRGRG